MADECKTERSGRARVDDADVEAEVARIIGELNLHKAARHRLATRYRWPLTHGWELAQPAVFVRGLAGADLFDRFYRPVIDALADALADDGGHKAVVSLVTDASSGISGLTQRYVLNRSDARVRLSVFHAASDDPHPSGPPRVPREKGGPVQHVYGFRNFLARDAALAMAAAAVLSYVDND